MEPGSQGVPQDEVVLQPRGRAVSPEETGVRSRGARSTTTQRRSDRPAPSPAPPSVSSDDPELRRRFAQFHSELAQASETIASLQLARASDAEQIAGLRRSLAEAEAREMEARRGGERAAALPAGLELRVGELEQQAAEAQTRHQVLGADLEAVRARLDEARKEAAILRGERDLLRQRAGGEGPSPAEAQLKSEVAQLKTEAAQLKADATQLRVEADDARRARTRSEAQVEVLKAHHMAELERMRLDHAASRLEAQAQVRLEFTGLDAELRAQLKKSEAERQALQAQVDAVREQLAREQQLRVDSRAVYETTLSRIRADHERQLRERVAEAESARKRSTDAPPQPAPQPDELRRLSAEVDELRKQAAEVTELRKRVAEVDELRKRAAEADELRKRVSELDVPRASAAEVDELRKRAAEADELRKQAAEVDELRKRAAEADELRKRAAEADELRKRAAEADELRKRAAEADELRGRIAELQEFHHAAEEGWHQAEELHKEIERQRDALYRQVGELKPQAEQRAQLEARLREVEAQTAAQAEQRQQIERALAASAADAEALRARAAKVAAWAQKAREVLSEVDGLVSASSPAPEGQGKAG